MARIVLIWIYLTLLLQDSVESEELEDEVTCEPPWIQVHRSCVSFHKEKFLDWYSARQDCQNKSADLLVVSDFQELTALRPVLRDQIKGPSLINWWIGLRYTTDESDWVWVDGSLLHTAVTQWAPNEPSGALATNNDQSAEPEDCVMLNYQIWLKDEKCAVAKPYICEQIKLTPPPSSSTTSSSTTPTTTTTTSTEPLKTTTQNKITKATTKAADTTSKTIEKSTEGTSSSTKGTSTISTTSKTSSSPSSQSTEPPATEPPTTPAPPDTTTTTARETTTEDSNVQPTPKPNDNQDKDKEKEKEEFAGCYAVNYGEKCPRVEAFGIIWPESEPGTKVVVQCNNGQAHWFCSEKPVCWKGEPSINQCTSKEIQDLTNQMEEFMKEPENPDLAQAFTENLAATASGSDSTMSEQDIYQSTVLMQSVVHVKPNNASQAKAIMKNVLACGSSLMAEEKKNTWTTMTSQNRKNVAASLLKSVEQVTTQMVQVYNEPTTETIQQDNMAMELHVVDPSLMFGPQNHVKYDGEGNNFNIPTANLLKFSKGGLARLVFIQYDKVDQFLEPADDDEDTERKVISHVISASIGDKNPNDTLEKPVTFTFETWNRDNTERYKQICAFWNFSLSFAGAWSTQGCELDKHNASHATCKCSHLTNFAILLDVHKTKVSEIHAQWLSYITYVGIIISIICCFLSLITFICLSIKCMRGSGGSYARAYGAEYEYGSGGSYSGSSAHTRSVQGERNSIHKHLVFTLFVAEILFLAGIDRTDHKVACAVIAGCLHFFFLSSFMWMFIEGIHILFMLVQVFDAAKSRLRYYYLLGYGGPLLAVGVSALVYHEGYGTDSYCWLTTDRMFIWSFAGPVAFILLVNLMILIYAMSAVCKHAEYVFSKEKSPAGNIKAWIQGALALEVLLGLTWVFGYFYISEEAIPMAYLFTIFNSLQGLFIFVFHCILNKKVRKEYERFIEYNGKSTSSGTHSSKCANGSGPVRGRKAAEFVDLTKDRKLSTKSSSEV